MIVDASVAVKWLIAEDGSDAADQLLTRDDLAAPDLLFAEVANVVWKIWRRGDFAQLPEGLEALPGLFQRIAPSAGLMAAATALAVELDHPAYDCVYLAMAIAGNEPLVTADGRFARTCAASRYADRVQILT